MLLQSIEMMGGQNAPEFVEIPGGTFVMGDDEGPDDEQPAHAVSLASFHLAVHPVTNLEYASFVQATGHRAPAIHELPVIVTAGGRDRERSFRQLAAPYVWHDSVPPPEVVDHPVTLVRFDDALAYCVWLTSQAGKLIRLPTEAEWERAARGGVERRRFPWGDEIDPTRSNYLSDPSLKALHGSRAVRTFQPNAYGLFDMSGNVWQWVSDWYDPEYYRQSPTANPTGPGAGRFRVVRGGAWLTADERMLTCAHRHKVPPDTYSYSIGFRVAY